VVLLLDELGVEELELGVVVLEEEDEGVVEEFMLPDVEALLELVVLEESTGVEVVDVVELLVELAVP
jgi:hypothetical protein